MGLTCNQKVASSIPGSVLCWGRTPRLSAMFFLAILSYSWMYSPRNLSPHW